MKKTIVMLLGLGLSCAVFASDNSGWQFTPGEKNPNQEFYNKTHAAFKDDITADQDPKKITLTKAQKHQALAWGLSEDQEKRYVMLMENQSGFFLSVKNNEYWTPVQVLGQNARTDKERAYYAHLAAEQRLQYLGKQLAYSNLEDQMYAQLMQQLNLKPLDTSQIDMAKFSPHNYEPLTLHQGEYFNLFVNIKQPIKTVMAYLLSKVSTENPLNIYFVGSVTSDQIQKWAKDQNIPQAYVAKGIITLNYDSGKFAGLHVNKALPVLMLSNSQSQQIVNIGRL